MDAMSGWGRLGDRGGVADLYGLGGLGGLEWTGRNTGLSGILDEEDWRTRRNTGLDEILDGAD